MISPKVLEVSIDICEFDEKNMSFLEKKLTFRIFVKLIFRSSKTTFLDKSIVTNLPNSWKINLTLSILSVIPTLSEIFKEWVLD